MVLARVSHTATLLVSSGNVLITGGIQGTPPNTTVLAEAELYDPSGTFTQTAGSLATAREWHAASLLTSGQVLITGGLDNTGKAIAAVELYDPTHQSFTPASGNLANARAYHTSTVLADGSDLIAGGSDVTAPLATAEVYSTATPGTFSLTGGLVFARESHTATLLQDGRVLVTGGTASVALASAELYQ